TILDQERVSIPVLDNDFDPDGTRDQLRVGLEGAPANATVDGDEVVVDVQPSRQVITYSVTDQDGLTAYAFVDVPGLEDSGPVLRTDADPIVVATGETRQLELADYVIAPSGKDVRLTDASTVRATNSDGSSPVVGPTTLTFTSAPTYAGPATLTFEVTDGQSAEDPEGLTAVLTLDILVESTENTPPTFTGAAVEVVPAEGPQVLNLRELADDPDTGDFNQLVYDLVSVPDGVAVRVAASTRRLATVTGVDLGELEQGPSQTVAVLQGAFHPFPDQPLTVVSAESETGGPTPTTDGRSVTVTAGADAVGRAS